MTRNISFYELIRLYLPSLGESVSLYFIPSDFHYLFLGRGECRLGRSSDMHKFGGRDNYDFQNLWRRREIIHILLCVLNSPSHLMDNFNAFHYVRTLSSSLTISNLNQHQQTGRLCLMYISSS